MRRTVGIVGAGDIVSKVHLPSLLATDGVDVAWVTDANAVRAKSMGAAFGVRSEPLPETLDQLPAADVTLLAIPFGVRDPYYQVLARRGTAVYVEKPFALTVDQHRLQCAMFPDHRLACGFQRRSWGPTLMLRDAIDSRLFGRLRAIRFGFGRRGAVGGGGYLSNVKLAGGGMLFESAIHGVDAILFLAGAVSVRVPEAAMILEEGFDLHTTARLAIRDAQGNSVEGELTISCLEDTTQRLDCVFDNATVCYSLFSEGAVEVKPVSGKSRYLLTGAAPYPLTSYETTHRHWRLFLEGIEAGVPNWTSASQSILTTEVIEQLYRAGREAAA
jgi:predicted dehydrogenase